MVVPTKTWYVDTNVIPSDQTTAANQFARMLLNIKRFLNAAGFYEDGVRVPDGSGQPGAWTVQRSSDGTANAGAGDFWLTVANIVQAAAGVNHSWIVLRSPVGTGFLPGAATFIEILFDVVTSAGTSEGVAVSVTPGSNPFTGGTLTTAPALPTNGVSLGNWQICENTILANHREHLWRNSEGDFMLLPTRDGSGVFGSFMWAWQGEGFEAGDVYPCAIGISSTTQMATNTVTVGEIQDSTAIGGWSTDNVQRDSLPGIEKVNSATIATAGFGAGGGLLGGRNPAAQIGLWQADTNFGIFHGRVPDVRYGSPAQGNLNLEVTSDVWKRLNVGELVLFKHDTDTMPVL